MRKGIKITQILSSTYRVTDAFCGETAFKVLKDKKEKNKFNIFNLNGILLGQEKGADKLEALTEFFTVKQDSLNPNSFIYENSIFHVGKSSRDRWDVLVLLCKQLRKIQFLKGFFEKEIEVVNCIINAFKDDDVLMRALRPLPDFKTKDKTVIKNLKTKYGAKYDRGIKYWFIAPSDEVPAIRYLHDKNILK